MRCSAALSSILSVRTESLPKSFIFLTIARSTQSPIDVNASRNPDLQALLRRGVRQDGVDHGWPRDEPIPNMRTVFRRSRPKIPLEMAPGAAGRDAMRGIVSRTVVKSLTQSSDGNGIARVLQRRICNRDPCRGLTTDKPSVTTHEHL